MLFSPQILVRNPPKRVVAAGGPFTFVAGVATAVVAGSGGGSSGAINTTGAGLLVCVTSYFSGASGLTFADSKSNTWAPLTAATSANTKCNIYYSIPTSVGASHTVSLTGTNIFCTLVFSAFTFGATPADQESTNNGSSTSATSTSITPSVNSELVIAGVGTNANAAAITGPGGNFTVIDATRASSSGINIGGGGAYSIQTTATAEAPTWTVASSSDWTTKMASFKVA